jgi:hypothetical protein
MNGNPIMLNTITRTKLENTSRKKKKQKKNITHRFSSYTRVVAVRLAIHQHLLQPIAFLAAAIRVVDVITQTVSNDAVQSASKSGWETTQKNYQKGGRRRRRRIRRRKRKKKKKKKEEEEEAVEKDESLNTFDGFYRREEEEEEERKSKHLS